MIEGRDEAMMTSDEYMQLLKERRAEAEIAAKLEWFRSAPIEGSPPFTPKAWVRPLLESFVLPGDEDLFTPPKAAPAPKREATPRTYRSAASLREERDALLARRDGLVKADDGSVEADPFAIGNISTQALYPRARAAGRRRFARMDRELERFASLTRRIDVLDSRIAKAEAREAHAESDSLSRSRKE